MRDENVGIIIENELRNLRIKTFIIYYLTTYFRIF